MRIDRVVSGRSRMNAWIKWTAAALVSVSSSVALAGSPPPPQEVKNQAFDWFVNNTPGYLPSPFLRDDTAGAVNAFLKTLSANQPKAVKLEGPISNATANLIFNNPSYQISYVFGDLEMGNQTPNAMREVAEQVRFINGVNNGTRTRSHNAFIGNFGIQKIPNDITDPSNYNSRSNQHSFSGFNIGAYNSA